MRSSPTTSARDTLEAFRASHRVRTHVAAGHIWDVIDTGTEGPAVVLLPGGGGSAESQFHLITAMEDRLRVVAIGCPPTLARISDAVAGLRALLDDHKVVFCFLLGHSLGGLLAQAFASAFRDRVHGLILANTGRYAGRRARLIHAGLASAQRLPRRAIAAMLSARVKRLLHEHPDRDFWLEYFTREELDRIGAKGIANRGACIADSTRKPAGGSNLRPYGGPTLIIESDNETGFTRAERATLRFVYPQAVIRMLRGAGHLSSITRRDEFVAEVLEFLERSQSPVPG